LKKKKGEKGERSEKMVWETVPGKRKRRGTCKGKVFGRRKRVL